MIIKDQKFNGKIYGKAGSYHIYVDNNKIEVSDSDVSDFNKYMQKAKKMLSYDGGILSDIEVKETNIKIGGEYRNSELNFAQIKSKIENFPVEIIWTGETKEGVKCRLKKVTYQGKFVVGQLEFTKNGEIVDYERLDEEDFELKISELAKK